MAPHLQGAWGAGGTRASAWETSRLPARAPAQEAGARAWASRTVGRVWNPRGSGKEGFCIFSSTLSCTVGSDATRVPPWMPKAQGHLNSGPESCFSHPARLSEGGKVCTLPAPKECHPLPGLLANLHQSWLPRQQWTQCPCPRLCQESTWKVVTDTQSQSIPARPQCFWSPRSSPDGWPLVLSLNPSQQRR